MTKSLAVLFGLFFVFPATVVAKENCQSLKQEVDRLNSQLKARSTESLRNQHRKVKRAYLDCLRISHMTTVKSEQAADKHVGNKRPRSVRYNTSRD